MWGFLVRHEGRLQGFVTVTTFTNYQKTFKWDSLNESAFVHDDDKAKQMRLAGIQKSDQDGSLARKLQATVRGGDVWQEGVVWPRIAEISLLGGLGCGRILLELVLEDLERMKASSKVNYDFVALQATQNSIRFYESLGFVRVGAVTQEKQNAEGNESLPADQTISPPRKRETNMDDEAKGEAAHESAFLALPQNYVASKTCAYEVKKAGEQLQAIAKKFKVDVYDILFLNHMNYPDMVPGSRLIKGTLLRIPDPSSESIRATRNNNSAVAAEELKWYTAKENDTPRSLARKFNVPCANLVQANKNRLKGLLSNSRLKQGTQVRISHLDAPDVHYVPYCHWAFPDDDDEFEEGEPSYMMALQLDRKKGIKAKERPIREGLATDIQEYQMPKLVEYVPTLEGGEKWSIPNKNPQEITSSDEEIPHARARITPGQIDSKENLFNVVVRVKNGFADTTDVDTREFKYWYVLTFIPDLRWCHLAPMVQDGVFGKDKPKFEGRARWKLVDESLGKELDISSSLCIPCRSKAVRRTVDADKEEWDILDDGKPFVGRRSSFGDVPVTSRQTSVSSTDIEEGHSSSRNRAKSINKITTLLARYPGVDRDVRVKLTGCAAPKEKQTKKSSNQKGSHKRKRSSEETEDSDDSSKDASETPSGGESNKEQQVPSSNASTSTATSSSLHSASLAKNRGRAQVSSTKQSSLFSSLENNSSAPANAVRMDLSCCV